MSETATPYGQIQPGCDCDDCAERLNRRSEHARALAAARDEVVRAAVAWYAARIAKRGPYMAEADALEAAVAALARLEKE